MITLKLKYEILVSGLYPFDSDFSKNGYILKKNNINDEIVNKNYDAGIIYMSPYLGFCTYQDSTSGKTIYLTFEKEKNIEIDLSSTEISDLKILNKKIEELDLFEEVEEFEKILTLQINNNIKFPIKFIKVYDVNDKFLTVLGDFSKINVPSLLCSNEEIFVEKTDRQKYRLTSGFSYEKITELRKNNIFFDRALTLYYSSFSANDEKVGFILLITSLEALLSLSTYATVEKCKSCSQDIYKISATISSNVNHILMGENEAITKIMKKKYSKRSKYLHGEELEISIAEEQELQEYVREVLLMYWNISLSKNTYDHKTIVAEFQTEEYKNNVIYKTFLEALQKQPFEETQKNILKQIFDCIIKNKK